MYNILGHTHFCQCELLMYISITFERSHVENVGAHSTGFRHLEKHRTVICSRLCELLLYVCICYVWTLTCVYMLHLNIWFKKQNVGANWLLTLYTCIMSNVSVTFEHWHMHTCYIWTLTHTKCRNTLAPDTSTNTWHLYPCPLELPYSHVCRHKVPAKSSEETKKLAIFICLKQACKPRRYGSSKQWLI